MKDRLVLYFGLLLLTTLKLFLCIGLITFLIIFLPIFMLVKKEPFYKYIDELYKTLK